MKKMIAGILAGILVLTLMACGQTGGKTEEPADETVETEAEVTPDGEEHPVDDTFVGDWTSAEELAITDEIMDLFEIATDGLTGMSYRPLACLETQVVAGTNYRLLCGLAPVSQKAVETYALVTLYADPEGGAQFTVVRNSDAPVEVINSDEPMTGGWAAPETMEMTQEAAEALTKAAQAQEGASYQPVALLATQLVSGTNYSILCMTSSDDPDREFDYVILHVYQDLDGNAEITDTFTFAETE